ncbi:MAG: cupin domain-containing protein [Chloroflexi bacterium]|nr:cupin domain-containing protein [Chloroflexota bacterium]
MTPSKARSLTETDIPWQVPNQAVRPADKTKVKALISEDVPGALGLDGRVSLNLTRLDPGERHLLHFHKTETILYYVLQGQAKLTLGEKVIEARPGVAAYVPAGTNHAVFNDGAAPFLMAAFVLRSRGKELTTEWLE